MNYVPDWLPDWRDAKAYPSEEGTSRWQWAWEFLRRSADYQQEYINWCQYDKPSSTKESLLEKYALVDLYDPATVYIPAALDRPKFKPLATTEIATIHNREPYLRADTEYDVLFKLDLSQPLSVQVDWLQRKFELLRNKLNENGANIPADSRERMDKYSLYLRLLDADLVGVSLSKEMLPIFAPGEIDSYPEHPISDRLRKQLKAAMQLRDAGYKRLLCVKGWEDWIKLRKEQEYSDS